VVDSYATIQPPRLFHSVSVYIMTQFIVRWTSIEVTPQKITLRLEYEVIPWVGAAASLATLQPHLSLTSGECMYIDSSIC